MAQEEPLLNSVKYDISSNAEKKKKSCTERLFTPGRLLFVFTFVNLVNYIDRGIVSGAGTSIQGCNSSCTMEAPCWQNTSCEGRYSLQYCSPFDGSCPVNNTCSASNNNSLCCNPQTGFDISTADLGILQSSFMIGYSIAIVLFGNLVH